MVLEFLIETAFSMALFVVKYILTDSSPLHTAKNEKIEPEGNS